MIRVHEGISPLLRRPMSIARQDGNRASVIFKVVGEGTAILASKKEGDELDVIGPFGNFFQPPPGKKVIMVGGGVGIPPLLFFASQNRLLKPTVIIGGASGHDLFGVEELESFCSEVIVTTEDGSKGIKGLATDPLVELDAVKSGQAHIIACGPSGMLKEIDRLCRKEGVQGELCTEERMACGFGVCLGCMVETTNGRKRVCVDGPVFKTGVIRWE